MARDSYLEIRQCIDATTVEVTIAVAALAYQLGKGKAFNSKEEKEE